MRVITPAEPARHTFLRMHVNRARFRTDEVLALDSVVRELRHDHVEPQSSVVRRSVRASDFFANDLAGQRLYIPVPVKPVGDTLADDETDRTRYADVTTLLETHDERGPQGGVLLLSGSGTGKTIACWKVFHDCLLHRHQYWSTEETDDVSGFHVVPPRLVQSVGCWLPLTDERLGDATGPHDLWFDLLWVAAFVRLPRSGDAHDRLRHWLIDGPRLFLCGDVNPVTFEMRLPVAEALHAFQSRWGRSGHRCLVTFRSTSQHSPAMHSLRAAFRTYELQVIPSDSATTYLRHFRDYENWVRRAVRRVLPTLPRREPMVAEIEAQVDELRQLIQRHVHAENSLISTPLLMHLVTFLRRSLEPNSPPPAPIRSLCDLYERVVELQLKREWKNYGRVMNSRIDLAQHETRSLTPPQHQASNAHLLRLSDGESGPRAAKIAMTRIALAMLAQSEDTATRISVDDARQWLLDPLGKNWIGPAIVPSDDYWQHDDRRNPSPYFHERFDRPELDLLLEFSLLKQE